MHSSPARFIAPVLFALAAACAASASAQTDGGGATHPFAASTPVPDRYIVVLRNDVASPAAEAAAVVRGAGAGAQLHHVYTTAIKGFAATLPAQALQGLRNNPAVESVEQDQTVSLQTTEYDATWGLDRIDQRFLALSGTYNYDYTGTDVTAFIIDTGIRADHVEFGGRVGSGFTSIGDGRGTADCNGHGTHVAGTVGGATWGVAKGVALVPVRVLDCRGSGTWSGVLAGIDWVAASAARPAVANMSLGGGKSSTVNTAVANAAAKGVTMVVAAGNSTADACSYSPASEPSAITVGASTRTDAAAYYSNWGACVDLHAPGSSITSAWHTSDTATNTISGTSMASPHAAGAAALVAQANYNAATGTFASPGAIASFLVKSATTGVLSALGTGSPNLLLYTLGAGSAAEPSATTIGIASLTGTGVKSGKNWRGRATVTVGSGKDKDTPVANVTVAGSFNPGGTASCVTDGTGRCTMTSAAIPSATLQTNFDVTNLTGSNMTFDGVTASTVINKP